MASSATSRYLTWHRAIESVRGLARHHACEWCGRDAAHWAYDWTDPNEFAEDGRVWSEDTRHYVAMCSSDHKRFDMTFRRVGRQGLATAVAPLRKAAWDAVSDAQREFEAARRTEAARIANAWIDSQDDARAARA